ncbi:MAG: hypothetical protein AB9882_01525 [Ignavibacteriaceae bacterium]
MISARFRIIKSALGGLNWVKKEDPGRLTIPQVITYGSRLAFRNLKFIPLIWFTNFAFAFALTLPVFSLFQESLAWSRMSDLIYREFDYIWLIQFLIHNERYLSVVPYTIFSVAGIYIIIQLFYGGGLLSVFINPSKNHHVDFFFGGVRHFYRFLKIAFIAFILYIIALLISDALSYLIKAIFAYSSLTWLEFILTLLRYLLFLLLIGVVSIISDYAKVVAVVTDTSSALRSILGAFRFIHKNFWRALSVFLILFLFLIIGVVVYNLVDGLIPRSPVWLILLTFIIQQLLIIYRTIIRLYVYSTEVVLFQDIIAELSDFEMEEIPKDV